MKCGSPDEHYGNDYSKKLFIIHGTLRQMHYATVLKPVRSGNKTHIPVPLRAQK